MSLLLNLRVIACLALAGILAFTHFAAYRKGKNDVRTEWNASVATANEEARRLERARQSAADAAGRAAASREAGIRADAARARSAVSGLRDELAALRGRSQSCPSEAERTAAVGELLQQCAQAHGELAERADRHVNDLKLLLEAWPK